LTDGRPPRRIRLDVLLVERGLAPTREKAQALILAGRVTREGRRLDKPGLQLSSDSSLELAPGRHFVGRGAGKLGPALARFGIAAAGRDAIDVGASTGGFTQVLLEAGALRVIALDVGRGQLDWTLRNDPRVFPIEGVNARYVEPPSLPFQPSLATIDVSFISLRQVLEATRACLGPGADIVALVKPQFELGKGRVGKSGIVRDPAHWDEVLTGMIAFSYERNLGPSGIARSVLPGAKGNVEFFLHLRPGAEPAEPHALDALRHEAVYAPVR
jgi:23S rRNA (cytidine1920-2'-O)/16S rRNA (cytidine1409-2'-O)-methyltransferase